MIHNSDRTMLIGLSIRLMIMHVLFNRSLCQVIIFAEIHTSLHHIVVVIEIIFMMKPELMSIFDKSRHDTTGQDSTVQIKTREDRTEQDRTNQGTTRQKRTGQDRTNLLIVSVIPAPTNPTFSAKALFA